MSVDSCCHDRNKAKAGAQPSQSKVAYPSWFFPSHFNPKTKSLLTALLEPDPSRRMSVLAALRQPWLADAKTVSCHSVDGDCADGIWSVRVVYGRRIPLRKNFVVPT